MRLLLEKSLPFDRSGKCLHEVIKEGDSPLNRVISVGDDFIAVYSKNVISRLFMFNLEGRLINEIPLPEMGVVSFSFTEENYREPAKDIFFSFSHFVQPPIIYRYSLKSHQLEVFKKPALCFNPEEYTTRQVFCDSKDGTKIPIFIVHKKDLQLEEPHQTLLYGYGGFGVSIYPYFNAMHLAWMEEGGIFASANIRGGAEFGEEWHKGGMGKNKQNCFDDFIAAAECLVASGYTEPSKLAIRGQSNGGLLAAVCINQRPELFGAALVGVGVLDMLRFPLFTPGRFWMSEYGNPQDCEDFEVLYRYSPYHNIRAGNKYPSTLITTGDHDDRVVPLHSYKYAAALQEAQGGNGKILLRVDVHAGHGNGKLISQFVEEAADMFSFLKRELK